MSWAHLHISFNHFPVMGAVCAFLLLCISLFWTNLTFRKITFALILLVCLSVIPTYIAGEQAEPDIARLPVPQIADYIEHHESAATTAAIASVIAGLLALAGLLYKEWPRWLLPTQFAVMLVLMGLFIVTSLYGGLIRHTEIRDEPVSKLMLDLHPQH